MAVAASDTPSSVRAPKRSTSKPEGSESSAAAIVATEKSAPTPKRLAPRSCAYSGTVPPGAAMVAKTAPPATYRNTMRRDSGTSPATVPAIAARWSAISAPRLQGCSWSLLLKPASRTGLSTRAMQCSLFSPDGGTGCGASCDGASLSCAHGSGRLGGERDPDVSRRGRPVDEVRPSEGLFHRQLSGRPRVLLDRVQGARHRRAVRPTQCGARCARGDGGRGTSGRCRDAEHRWAASGLWQ